MVNQKIVDKLTDEAENKQFDKLEAAADVVNKSLANKFNKDFGKANKKPSKKTLQNYVESVVDSYTASDLREAANRSLSDQKDRADEDLGAMDTDSDDGLAKSDRFGTSIGSNSRATIKKTPPAGRAAFISESLKPIIEDKLKKRFGRESTSKTKVDFISDSIKPKIDSEYSNSSKPIRLSELEKIVDSKICVSEELENESCFY